MCALVTVAYALQPVNLTSGTLAMTDLAWVGLFLAAAVALTLAMGWRKP